LVVSTRGAMLATARLKLRRFTEDDVPRVAEICSDWRVASMCRVVPYPYSEADAHFFVGTVCAALDGLVLAIETLHDRKLIGCVSLEDFRKGDGGGAAASLGYWLAADAWGSGYATEAASAILDYAFRSRGVAIVESGYWAENVASARVQAKLHFRVVRSEMMRCVARSCELEQVCTRVERSEWQRAAAAPRPPPAVVRGLLSDDDIRSIESYARQLMPELADDGSADASGGGWTRYGDGHEATFLHHGGTMHDDVWRTFAQACAQLDRRLHARVRDVAASAGLCDATTFEGLNVRCVEHHTYTAGGGLTDRGH